MTQPLVWLGIFFCLGIVTASYLQISFLLFWLAACLCLILSVIFFNKRIRFVVFILCVVFFLGALHLKNSQLLPKSHIGTLTPYKSELVSLKGTVNSYSKVTGKRTSFIFRVEHFIKNQSSFKVCGKVLAYIFKKESFSYGEELILRGSLYRP
ncbi:MAG: ComEC/Rec2 family competence protein, partial [Candidatus Omnitrophota bacterium]|nr:ComEC/Rec2 family competence protein [Candidatus Omnitrophota bacterium]